MGKAASARWSPSNCGTFELDSIAGFTTELEDLSSVEICAFAKHKAKASVADKSEAWRNIAMQRKEAMSLPHKRQDGTAVLSRTL
jgi:hypothetical protein